MKSVCLHGGVLVNRSKLNKQLFYVLQGFIRSYAFMDYDTEEEFRQTLREYLAEKGYSVGEDLIDEIISRMPFKSWEY